MKKFVSTNQGLGYLAVGNMTANVLGGIFWIVLATFVTTDTYGKASYFTSVASFAVTVALIGFPIFLTTFLAKGVARVRQEIASLTLLLSIAAAIICFLIFQYVPLSILVVGVAFFSVAIQDLIGEGRYRQFAIINIGQKAANLALSISLYFFMGFDGIIWGYTLSYLAFGFRTVINVRHFTLSFTTLKEKKSFLFHSWGLDLSKAVSYSTDKFLIAPIFGFAVLGAYQLGIQFLMLQSLIPNTMFPYLLREQARGISRKYVKIYGLALTIAISAAVSVAAPYVVPVVFPKFIESIVLIQIATWGAPLMVLNSIFGSELLALEKSRGVFVASAIFFGVSYLLMYYLGTAFGAIGIVYGLLSALAAETACLFVAKKRCEKSSRN
jgi:O-antigen/teichoic acid export membrane protein